MGKKRPAAAATTIDYPFSEKLGCPKCFGTSWHMLYVPEGMRILCHDQGGWFRKAVWSEPAHIPEHLEMSCKRCGFFTRMACGEPEKEARKEKDDGRKED